MKTDDTSSEKVVDYGEGFLDYYKAEGKGRNFLALEKLDVPVRRADGKKAGWLLTYAWLSVDCESPEDEAWACQLGRETTLWQRKELVKNGSLKKGKSLFDCFNLFG